MGLHFSNKLGLGAGFDKDGKHIRALSKLGFGFIEMCTVTPLPQPGNPRPRLFRLPQDDALINRMGFNNEGMAKAVERLSKLGKRDFILGANIGKNKITPNDQAVEDYHKCVQTLHPWIDYFTVNVSSPNTPGLRELQEKEPLKRILSRIMEVNADFPVTRPILLKIAPDLTTSQIRDAADLVNELNIDGIIGTNTTISRDHLHTSEKTLHNIGAGGLSGRPLKHRATEVIKQLRADLKTGKIVIGIGGIESGEDAVEKLNAGADLVQIYTGFIYKGPGLISEIVRTTNS
jgi:dihydroorotate dehydrogenase